MDHDKKHWKAAKVEIYFQQANNQFCHLNINVIHLELGKHALHISGSICQKGKTEKKVKQLEMIKEQMNSFIVFQALVIVMPMLGCGYLITMVGPDHTATPWGYTAFQIGRSVVLSTQVTLLAVCWSSTSPTCRAW